MEIFATGLQMGESPRWHDGRLWVCDWLAGHVVSYDADGAPRVELAVPGLPFSLEWLPDGRPVLACAQGVVTAGEDGTLTAYGATDRAWNEIVVGPRGLVYVDEAGFDLMAGEEPRAGSVWVVRPDGSSEQVAGDVWFPNGMAVTADGTTLLVAESYATGSPRSRSVTTGPERAAGVGRPRRGHPRRHLPRRRRRLLVRRRAAPSVTRVAEGGAVLEVVDADRGCFACMLGGPDGRTLYVVATAWAGVAAIGAGEPSGQVLVHRAPSPHAGRP